MNKYKDIAKKLRKQVEKDFGKKCKDFDFGCIVCQSHRVFDNLEELGSLIDVLNKKQPKIHDHKK